MFEPSPLNELTRIDAELTKLIHHIFGDEIPLQAQAASASTASLEDLKQAKENFTENLKALANGWEERKNQLSVSIARLSEELANAEQTLIANYATQIDTAAQNACAKISRAVEELNSELAELTDPSLNGYQFNPHEKDLAQLLTQLQTLNRKLTTNETIEAQRILGLIQQIELNIICFTQPLEKVVLFIATKNELDSILAKRIELSELEQAKSRADFRKYHVPLLIEKYRAALRALEKVIFIRDLPPPPPRRIVAESSMTVTLQARA